MEESVIPHTIAWQDPNSSLGVDVAPDALDRFAGAFEPRRIPDALMRRVLPSSHHHHFLRPCVVNGPGASTWLTWSAEMGNVEQVARSWRVPGGVAPITTEHWEGAHLGKLFGLNDEDDHHKSLDFREIQCATIHFVARIVLNHVNSPCRLTSAANLP